MKIIYKILVIMAIVSIYGCSDMLNLRPTDKIDGKAMFSDPEGVKLYMANLYSSLPIEDFNYMRDGFNGWIGENMVSAMFTEEATNSEYVDFLSVNNFSWWDKAFGLIRDVNILAEEIPDLKISIDERNAIIGEVAFIRAYTYFGLVKRYGGVPLIKELQQWTGDVEALKIPRSTEKDTWDYILEQCDIAADNLPQAWDGGQRRATTWVASAFKSRVALHAASLAKFGGRAVLSGAAVDQHLVGLSTDLANGYYEAAIKAAIRVMSSNKFDLYKPSPSSPDEAAENYRKIFENPANAPMEAMFVKGYTKLGMGHSYEVYYGPQQTANGWPHPGRMNPNLELMDAYERYDNPGENAPIKTSDAADDLTDYLGYSSSKNYYKFDKPYGIFEGKDARLWGTAILPGTMWKNTTIVIQAGFIMPDGTPRIFSGNPYTMNGITYYVFGGATTNSYSGFDTQGGNYTRTGVSFKKFLDQNKPVVYGYLNSLTDYIDIRYAEVLLNYAEAVVESGYVTDNAPAIAKEALNKIRRRAGHTTEIALTVANVQRERLVELAFENKRFWDLKRRREYHTLFNNSRMHALLPVLDLRESPPKYIFIRSDIPRKIPHTFREMMYYYAIPGIAANGLVQNPQY